VNIGDISVVVFSENNETTIGRCLDAVRDFGEVFVVDEFSTDNTKTIVRQYPVTLYQRSVGSPAAHRLWAGSRSKSPWVMFLNADEVVTSQLRREIGSVADPPRGGYGFRVRYVYLGRELKRGACPRRTGPLLMARAETESARPAEFLQAAIFRHGFADVHSQFEAINQETSRNAQGSSGLVQWLSVPLMLFVPPAVFFYKYFLRFGLGDGAHGFLYCLLSAYGVFIQYAKIRERGFAGSDPQSRNVAESN
jgi:hypothetical protein